VRLTTTRSCNGRMFIHFSRFWILKSIEEPMFQNLDQIFGQDLFQQKTR
jgi:hypothetical protein